MTLRTMTLRDQRVPQPCVGTLNSTRRVILRYDTERVVKLALEIIDRPDGATVVEQNAVTTPRGTNMME